MTTALAQRIAKLTATVEKMKAAGADPADYADLVEMLDTYRSLA